MAVSRLDSSQTTNSKNSSKQKTEEMGPPTGKKRLLTPKYPRTVPTYTEDYGPKPHVKREIMHHGVASESCRNNPHPGESFMVWRLPSRFPPLIEGHTLSYTNQEVEDVIRAQGLKSTYQDDYTGLPQGTWLLPPLPSSNGASSLPKPSKPSILSEMRGAYQTPQQTTHLKGNSTRYGCSVNFVKAACGVVPTLPPNTATTSYQTWYSNEFSSGVCGEGLSHKRPPTPIHPLRLPPIHERTQLTGKSARLRQDKLSGVQRSVKSAMRSKNSLSQQTGLSWLSEWAGPM